MSDENPSGLAAAKTDLADGQVLGALAQCEGVPSHCASTPSAALREVAQRAARNDGGVDAVAIIGALRRRKTIAKRHRRWSRSELAQYRAEITDLRRRGASLSEIAEYLLLVQRCSVNKTTVMRYLAKLEASDGPAH